MTSLSSTGKSTARDVFSYLLMIAMFYTGVVSFTTLLFQMINAGFPDVLDYYPQGAYDIMKSAISALVVAWPVFILMSWVVNNDLRHMPSKQDLWVRKWLMYLTLFIASITVVVDLITLVNYFLDGEISARFILKVLTVMVVACGVFSYYFWELRREVQIVTSIPRLCAIGSSCALLLAVICGFVVVGTPGEQRAMRMDEQRVYDLQSIQSQTLDYWIKKQTLPESTNLLVDSFSGYQVPVDPSTKQAYEYRVLSDLSFEVCAVFETSSERTNVSYHYPGDVFTNFNHEAQRTCFERVIDPELYKDQTSIITKGVPLNVPERAIP